MDQKAKFIIIGLIGILIVAVAGLWNVFSAKQAVTVERDSIKKENDSLSAEVQKRMQEYHSLEARSAEMSAALDQAKRESEDNRKRFENAEQARTALLDKLKEAQAAAAKVQAEPPPQQVSTAPTSADDYWAGVLKEKTDLQLQLDGIRNDLKQAQINNEQLQRDKAAVELDLANVKRDSDELKRQFEYNKKMLDSMSVDLILEKTDKMKIQDAAKVFKNENSVLRQQIHTLNTLKINLERKVATLATEKKDLEDHLAQMDAAIKDKVLETAALGAKVSSAEEPLHTKTQPPADANSVELPAIVVRPHTGATSSLMESATKGKVVAVNKVNNFVIIDLGEDSGIRLGQNFQVVKGAKTIANLEVIQVRKEISACDIKKEYASIEIGDSIK